MQQYNFTLYVAGNGELTARALANFERLIRSRLGDRCSLTTVDIVQEPGQARTNRVVATPLLVRESPLPLVKVLGDLSHEQKLLTQLGIETLAAELDGPVNRAEGDQQ